MIFQILEAITSNLGSIPLYHAIVEVGLLLLIIWLLFKKSYKIADGLTEKEKDELIADWEPEPLIPDCPPDHPAINPDYIQGKAGKHVEIEGERFLNLATNNFLGLIGNERIEEAAQAAIYQYGVGTCGPRTFYGTVDVHLKLEEEISSFLEMEESVLYSYGFSTIASAIPAYAKLGDVVFCDKGATFAIQKGLQASRSRVEWFEHNDMEDLERLLKIQALKDKQNPKKAKVTRRFVVVEGISQKYGDIAPLPKLLELKWKYKVRIFIEESYSFGVLGATGKGITEHFNVKVEDVDMICGSLENAIGSTGGFCSGRRFVVEHQRLSGIGYCFSASLPALLTIAASKALEIIQEPGPSGEGRIRRLQSNSSQLISSLKSGFAGTRFLIQGQPGSPICHIKWIPYAENGDREEVEEKLDAFVSRAREKRILITRARYLDNEEAFPPQPSIRLSVNSELEPTEIENVVEELQTIAIDLS